jgi:hypothetical protein
VTFDQGLTSNGTSSHGGGHGSRFLSLGLKEKRKPRRKRKSGRKRKQKPERKRKQKPERKGNPDRGAVPGVWVGFREVLSPRGVSQRPGHTGWLWAVPQGELEGGEPCWGPSPGP